MESEEKPCVESEEKPCVESEEKPCVESEEKPCVESEEKPGEDNRGEESHSPAPSVNAEGPTTLSQPVAEKEAKVEVLSHTEIMHVIKDTVAGLISTDPLLKDLHPYVTLEEVNSMIALEYGQAMVVNVQRADNEIMRIVVKQEATVLELKHGIKRFMTLQLSRTAEGSIPISWRYIWKRYWLYFEGEKLTDDNKLLKDYGIRNRDTVTFIKRLRER